MIALDTNILARFSVEDPGDPEAAKQRPIAYEIFSTSPSLFVPLSVVPDDQNHPRQRCQTLEPPSCPQGRDSVIDQLKVSRQRGLLGFAMLIPADEPRPKRPGYGLQPD
ncbi:hypothetical protein Thivi_3106 [Thiocystis violascens DSM 198]|uniref:PIN domain-containing protein n=1 Tax=Thiocystis violascens (strain ATCC 17096 / DSM 198 / 6111) TaxID=765911 RepID=I3YDB5_THIV6|nr:hypothetical protein Thivi_3106 [Thiocystis violascens DSM 198]